MSAESKMIEYAASYRQVTSKLNDRPVSLNTVFDILDGIQEDIEDGEGFNYNKWKETVNELPSVTPERPKSRCKDCKFFEYDSIAKVDGVPLIVAHEICNRWGDGCKSKEDGYCFLFEPREDGE